MLVGQNGGCEYPDGRSENLRSGGKSAGKIPDVRYPDGMSAEREFRMRDIRMECRRRRNPDVRHLGGMRRGRFPDAICPGEMRREGFQMRYVRVE
ncbi:hypothetical protein VitviT2T_023388 [Vitis vinifera]|uniref:Uncharacterized protein n=1 Tax=Vitis vinifera TaxID=29760 RepID=A0ABY9DDG5_VITVI|nr:hypothetical protein VitviT2T_023388 [Vitis vinifera]